MAAALGEDKREGICFVSLLYAIQSLISCSVYQPSSNIQDFCYTDEDPLLCSE